MLWVLSIQNYSNPQHWASRFINNNAQWGIPRALAHKLRWYISYTDKKDSKIWIKLKKKTLDKSFDQKTVTQKDQTTNDFCMDRELAMVKYGPILRLPNCWIITQWPPNTICTDESCSNCKFAWLQHNFKEHICGTQISLSSLYVIKRT